MSVVKELIKIFDREFIDIIFIGSAVAAMFLAALYDLSVLQIVLLSPLAFLGVFFGLIALAHIVSFIMSAFEKITSRN